MATEADFETQFRSVFPRLVSLGALKSGSVEIARELAQETMARAHQRWDEVGRYDAPDAWCRAVMVNLLIDHHRSSSAERRAVERLGDGAMPMSTQSTPDLDDWERLVAPLSEHQRMVVTLFYADDLSVGQIAQLLDTSTGAVKATLFKARRTLRRHLDQERRDD